MPYLGKPRQRRAVPLHRDAVPLGLLADFVYRTRQGPGLSERATGPVWVPRKERASGFLFFFWGGGLVLECGFVLGFSDGCGSGLAVHNFFFSTRGVLDPDGPAGRPGNSESRV